MVRRHPLQTSNGRFDVKLGSDRPQTLPKRVSDDPRHFIFRRRKFFQNFERPFTPRGWLRSASNFGEMRFRRFPTFHFSTPNKKFWQKFLLKIFCWRRKMKSANCLFWRSCELLVVNIRCASKIHCQTYRFQPSMTLGGGVKEAVCVFTASFDEKKLIPSSLRYHDSMILWYYDTMILWPYDKIRILLQIHLAIYYKKRVLLENLSGSIDYIL